MEDYYEHPKPYCKEGESESHIGLAWAIVACIVAVPAWMLFLHALGF
jgi:hypothetical protein